VKFVPAARTLVSWVIVKTKTRSKKSSRVRRECFAPLAAPYADHSGFEAAERPSIVLMRRGSQATSPPATVRATAALRSPGPRHGRLGGDEVTDPGRGYPLGADVGVCRVQQHEALNALERQPRQRRSDSGPDVMAYLEHAVEFNQSSNSSAAAARRYSLAASTGSPPWRARGPTPGGHGDSRARSPATRAKGRRRIPRPRSRAYACRSDWRFSCPLRGRVR
jgi:hypothetical protein